MKTICTSKISKVNEPNLLRQAALLLVILLVMAGSLRAQVKLEADGPGSTYALIESKFQTGIEDPDCSHTSFGPHITETFDTQLNKNVFVFHIHADIDNDRCTNFDRQRNEIKGGGGSPADMQHTSGQTAYERWKFKLDAGFVPSSRFTHIMQIKAMDGDAGAPLMTLTPRAGSPQRMQVIHSSGEGTGSQGTIAEVDLAPFKGTWVEAFMTYRSSEGSGGTFSLVIKRISDSATLLSVSRTGIDMWRTGASYNRPKWGIYRGLDDVLRDEQVRFADFCITESSASLCPSSIGTGTAPAAPSALTASAVSSSQINLSWSDNSGNESAFRIERSTDAGATWSLLTTLGANVTSYSNTGLAASTTYSYRVRAENSVGNSAFSNTASATTQAAGTVPAAPSGLSASAVSSSQIDLSWVDNSGNESLFRIEQSTDAGATWSSLTTVGANVTTYSNTGLSASTTYHYRVRAENATGNSGYSNTANATTSGGTTLPAIGIGTTQAESLNMVGYESNLFEGVTCARALSTTLGHVKGTFTGSTGTYTLTVRAFDENDGASTLTVRVNGTSVGTRTLSVNDHTWKDWVLSNISIANGSEIRIEGAHEAGEHARIDFIQVASAASGDIYLEAESGSITSPMQVLSSSSASGGQYIAVAAGNNSQTAAPSTGRATYSFSVSSAGTYKVWGRVIAATTGDDSFWVRMDGGTWINWNEVALGSTWHWDEVHNSANANTVVTFSLAAGSHTLDIAYREDGAQLDRLLITNNLSLNPNTAAATASALMMSPEGNSLLTEEFSSGSDVISFPNPSSREITVKYKVRKAGNVRITLHNGMSYQSSTLVNEHKSEGVHETKVDISALPKGVHVIRFVNEGSVSVSKLIKQ